MKRLNAKIATALLAGVRATGSYTPDDVLPRIEESLTGPEYAACQGFLAWVAASSLTRHFGHGNLMRRYAEYLAAKKG